ncbi:O-antigen ligase family protein [Maribacter sp. CXY002]|uniref:O-antigen ligase family protein n=1 Tax=Maribacter luteocoastalis TaxID=3407671 RepID=UPI003B67E907
MYTNTKKNYSIGIGLLILVNLLFLMVGGPFFGIQSVGTYVLLPTMFLITIVRDRFTWDQGNFLIKVFAVYWLYSLVTVFYYVDLKGMIRDLSGLTGTLFASYCALALNKRQDHENFYHWGYILAIVLLIAIEFLNGTFYVTAAGFQGAEVMISPETGPRLDRGIFLHNANAYSYYSFFANISLFYLYLNYRNKFMFFLLVTLPVVFILFTFVTQSRSGLFLLIFSNVVFWIFINRNRNKNPLMKIGRFLVLISVIVFAAIRFITILENSEFINRMSTTEGSTVERGNLIKEGIDMFLDAPIFGIGLGQFSHYSSTRQFSHNSFVEILAEQGFIGGFFLMFIFGFPTLKSIKNLFYNPGNELARLNFLFFLAFLLFNNVYVFYKFSFSMTYFFLIVAIQNKYEKSLVYNNNQYIVDNYVQ